MQNASGAVTRKTINNFKKMFTWTVCCKMGVNKNEYTKSIRMMKMNIDSRLFLYCVI